MSTRIFSYILLSAACAIGGFLGRSRAGAKSVPQRPVTSTSEKLPERLGSDLGEVGSTEKINRIEAAKARGAEHASKWLDYKNTQEGLDVDRREARIKIRKNYGPLIRKLNLPPEKQGALLHLLIENASLSKDAFYGAASKKISRESLQSVINQQRVQLDSEIKTVLGDDYQKYKQYNESFTERLELIDIANGAMSSSEQLTDDQITALAFSYDKINSKAPGYSKVPGGETPESVSERYTQLLAEARGVLNSDQYKLFEEAINDRVVVKNTKRNLVNIIQ